MSSLQSNQSFFHKLPEQIHSPTFFLRCCDYSLSGQFHSSLSSCIRRWWVRSLLHHQDRWHKNHLRLRGCKIWSHCNFFLKATLQKITIKNWIESSNLLNVMNRPFATSDHVVQNPPCWRASSLLFPHWDVQTKTSQASLVQVSLF